jgi:hypothetical protein
VRKAELNINKVFMSSPMVMGVCFLMVGCLYLSLSLFDYSFIPNSSLVYDSFTTAIVICFTVTGIKYRTVNTRTNNVFSALLPLTALFFLFFSLTAIDRKSDYTYILHSFITIVCSLILAFSFTRRKAIKIGLGVIYLVLFLFIIFYLFIMLIMADFGKNTVVKTEMSPNNVYLAEIIDNDQGALGGNTIVTISRQNYLMNLFIGRFTKRIYTGRWGEFETMTIRWETDKILYINGSRYMMP